MKKGAITEMAQPPRLTSRTEPRFPILPQGDDRAVYVRENFDRIARSYDRFNDLSTFGLHRLWKRRTVRESGLTGKNAQVLDLCTGTGDLAFLFARKLGPGSRVTALDFSPGMLFHLTERLKKRPTSVPVSVVEGDALHLPSSDASFQAVCVGFGLRNVKDRARALSEIFRVLSPGGRALILDVGRPRFRLIGFFHRFYFEFIVPRMGAVLDPENPGMYAYLPASAREYPDPEILLSEMAGVGFRPVGIRRFLFGAAALVIAEKAG